MSILVAYVSVKNRRSNFVDMPFSKNISIIESTAMCHRDMVLVYAESGRLFTKSVKA